LAATWSETGRVHLLDLTAALSNVDDSAATSSAQSALFTFTGHQSEGYAIDWSTLEKGLVNSVSNAFDYISAGILVDASGYMLYFCSVCHHFFRGLLAPFEDL